ncbi:MAG TPA: hypothetical protein PK747_00280 [Acidobacteriota bacterium]|jgi:hypothetical protein|nr:hypothetical protein [Acidobacteriota bacterium]HNT16769.1 hypothetical protein [Acidobacteriota bacterium]HPA26903.1 hypothetical protein [Acidobacteriota bacterium]HQO20021.1 hypothetical protein [Acidobacteriota bacterium]HQQ45828.1 hypothetical protein [Acidobacteriota bacterium]
MRTGVRPYLLSLPTLVLPGLSHFVLGRRKKAAGFFLIVGSTFLAGLLMDGGVFTLRSSNWLYKLAGAGELGMGLPYLLCVLSGVNRIVPETVTSVMFGYGSTFLITAGLMNMLLMMDAFDISIGRKAEE